MKMALPQGVWGLSQGLLGRARATLAPSLAAVGPNTYLNQRDFLKMLGVAFLVHAMIFTIAALLPGEKVTNIPVRALSFKLGDHDQAAAYAPSPSPAAVAAPVMQAVSADSWRAAPNTPAPAVPEPLKPVARAAANKPVVKPAPAPVPAPPAVAPTPQQFVREVGAPSPQAVAKAVTNAGVPTGAVGGQGVSSTVSEATRARYTQEVSAWIQQHKYYPASAAGREGRAVVRMRIDRAGNVRYYAIEQSAGLVALDEAALDMIRRANPVPAVPVDYPAGSLVEFLIPITFKAPL